MTVETKPVTAEELLRMEGDELRRELVRGEVREMAPAGGRHGFVAGEIHGELRNYVKANDLGWTFAAETGFKISSDPDTVRAPDAAFVRKERVEAAGAEGLEGYFPGAPDLACEVVSPNDRHSEVLEKALDWLRAGCRMVLVVEPRGETVTVYRALDDVKILSRKDRLDGADVLPGWSLAVEDLFA